MTLRLDSHISAITVVIKTELCFLHLKIHFQLTFYLKKSRKHYKNFVKLIHDLKNEKK
jgi:hypothetical protein